MVNGIRFFPKSKKPIDISLKPLKFIAAILFALLAGFFVGANPIGSHIGEQIITSTWDE